MKNVDSFVEIVCNNLANRTPFANMKRLVELAGSELIVKDIILECLMVYCKEEMEDNASLGQLRSFTMLLELGFTGQEATYMLNKAKDIKYPEGYKGNPLTEFLKNSQN